MVITRPKRYRDSLQAHYTASTPIVSFMVSRLEAANDDVIWEPCAGAGDLIDGVLNIAPHAQIRASEINPDAASQLTEKYSAHTAIDVRNEDAIELGNNCLFDGPVSFTRIIANPPYGAYQSPARRKQLQRRFRQLYVRESYGVILYHALSLLRNNGRLVFIIPDTFLWLTRHEILRRAVIEQTTVNEIALFPSKFFPGINFGYSGLCIISITRRAPAPDHSVRIITNFRSATALSECIGCPDSQWPCTVTRIRQADIATRSHAELVLQNGGGGVSLNRRAEKTLGDHAEVKTGFYSGNDRRWIRKLNESTPRSKTYQKVCRERIFEQIPPLSGLSGQRIFIPIVRGGAAPYIKPTRWFVDWSSAAVSEYSRKGKNPARFQNSRFYFREGIGIPMVASGRITGALLENRLFDQGIVGIFPHDESQILYLLGFFNSEIATELIREINPTANNSANYVKRLPLIIPTSSELSFAEKLVHQAVRQTRESGTVSDSLQERIDTFYSKLWKAT